MLGQTLWMKEVETEKTHKKKEEKSLFNYNKNMFV
jgi:hypothetical protein